MPQHVRKGDQVMVISGRDRKKIGTVLRVFPQDQKVLVEGVNVVKRHVRPSQENQQGGVVDKELPIHWSNVQPVVDGKPTRVRFETRPDGSKLRVAVKTGQPIGAPLRQPTKA